MNKFCVTATWISFEKALLLAQKHNFIELRLDKSNLTYEELTKVVAVAQNSIVSCIDCDASFTFERLNAGVAAGVNIIDVPYEFLNTMFFKELKRTISKNKIKLIVSYHSFSRKDSNDVLIDILNNVKTIAQPDYYKIAMKCETHAEIEDFFNLFSMSDKFKELVLVPMSQNHPQARLDSLKLGSPYMYCFDEELSPGPVAPGQLSVVTMKNMLQHPHN